MNAIKPGDHPMADFRRSAEARYDGVARLLHWSIVVLITIQFVIGWTMPDVHKDTRPVGLIAWHLGVGSALITVMVLRVLWRLTHRPAPDDLPPLLGLASRVTHLFLYICLLLVPLP